MDSSQEERVEMRGTMYPDPAEVEAFARRMTEATGHEHVVSPEPDTVAEEQLEALRRENERLRNALRRVRDEYARYLEAEDDPNDDRFVQVMDMIAARALTGGTDD